MIVGHVVGQDAVSAINLVLPLVEVLNCMAFLICFGAYAMGGWLQMLSYGMCLFVATDGRPRMVTIAVVGGADTHQLPAPAQQFLPSEVARQERGKHLHRQYKGGCPHHREQFSDGVFVTLKDAGKPFDPVKAGKMADANIGTPNNEHLGLRLVTHIIPDITYKFMYGQNTVFIWKKSEGQAGN